MQASGRCKCLQLQNFQLHLCTSVTGLCMCDLHINQILEAPACSVAHLTGSHTSPRSTMPSAVCTLLTRLRSLVH